MASSMPMSKLPTEIWLTIFSHLSESDFLTLKLTSPYLRNLISQNAAAICNAHILTHYASEAAIMGTTIQDGWLVPTHPLILREEQYRDSPLTRKFRAASRAPPTPPSSFTHPAIITKLSVPGPQYLRFLTEYTFDIRIAYAMFLDVDSPAYCCYSGVSNHKKFEDWVGLHTVRRFLRRLQALAAGQDELSFCSNSSWKSDCVALKTTEEGLAWFYT